MERPHRGTCRRHADLRDGRHGGAGVPLRPDRAVRAASHGALRRLPLPRVAASPESSEGVLSHAIVPQPHVGDGVYVPAVGAFTELALDLGSGITVASRSRATSSRWRISATGRMPRSRPIRLRSASGSRTTRPAGTALRQKATVRCSAAAASGACPGARPVRGRAVELLEPTAERAWPAIGAACREPPASSRCLERDRQPAAGSPSRRRRPVRRPPPARSAGARLGPARPPGVPVELALTLTAVHRRLRRRTC